MNNSYSVVTSAYPDRNSALKAAHFLVEKGLAACVQTFPIESVYRWKGQIENAKEYILWIKTRTALVPDVIQSVKETHPHTLPEILSMPVETGLPAYLSWIDENTKKSIE